MDKSHILACDGLLPAQVVGRLRMAFPLIQVSSGLGGYRRLQRIRQLRKARAPEVVLQIEERIRKEILQVTVFDGNPLTQVLDLTVCQGWVRAYHRDGAEEFLRKAGAALGYDISDGESTDEDDDQRQS